MYGWMGTILSVDLSDGRIVKEPLSEALAAKYMGGEALGVKLLYERTPAGIDALDPRMLLSIGVGPGTGTLIPGSGRTEVVTKSPLTGITMGDSNAGGHFGPALKYAGYDILVVTGKAEHPVYLWIDDDDVEIRDARHLWGKDVYETVESVRSELDDPNIQTFSIGPAGESQVHFAGILANFTRAAGRSGTGAVMGSKNLKLVAARGTKPVKVKRPEAFYNACWGAREKLRKTAPFPAMQKIGTPIFIEIFDHLGYLSALNFKEGVWDGAKNLYGDLLVRDLEVKSQGCWGCQICCSHILRVKDGPYAGLVVEGVEFFATMMFGSMLGVPDYRFVAKAQDECSRLGLDIANTGGILAWLCELYERGIVSKADLDGLDFSWGNEASFLAMTKKIARREGIGDLLAQGIVPAATQIGKGAEQYTTSILNQTPPEDFKKRYGVALCHITSTRGADQQKGLPHAEIRGGNPEAAISLFGDKDAFNTEVPTKKPEAVRWVENRGVVYDSLSMCRFNAQRLSVDGPDLDDIGRMLTALTGIEYTGESLWQFGEMAYRLEMAYNAREGRQRGHFNFDFGGDKWTKQSFSKGPWTGKRSDPEVISRMVDEYLRMRGFDPISALPTRQGLEHVGLSDIADDMARLGLLVE
ncbi:MAG: hypothetical protein EPO21_16485 [Chloroflexota bacterium]|nr:MAG: hypothetical protein EPO21_16485 [Chloroflexota bacterium]